MREGKEMKEKNEGKEKREKEQESGIEKTNKMRNKRIIGRI